MKFGGEFSRRTFVRRAMPVGIAVPHTIQSELRAARNDLKIFVHWDMEGASGIFTREQAWVLGGRCTGPGSA